jgi:hypothetical protein
MKEFDPEGDNIILISYPSGGFGNFLYHILTEHADNTVKIKNTNFNFSSTGDSHSTSKYTNIFQNNSDTYQPAITDNVDITDKKILVLCDNGIENDLYTDINKLFPNATIVRTVISPVIRPIIYQTCIVKAMRSDVISESKNHVQKNWIDGNEPYAIRENFTLFYHNWPFLWGENDNCINLNLELLITDTFSTIVKLIEDLNMKVINTDRLKKIINEWTLENSKYFQIYYDCKKIIHALNNNTNISLSHITSLHDQGYINYFIEKKYNITIPVFDYKNWFENTSDLHYVIKKINEKNNFNDQ